VDNTVFAFGGYGPVTVCEKCSLPLTRWTQLLPMHCARAGESFSPATETFTVLPVSLPADLVLGCGSVAFVANGELVLLSQLKQVAR